MDTSDSQDEIFGPEHDEALIDDSPDSEDEQPSEESPVSGPEASQTISFQQRKWNRVRKHYHDQYLELFKSTIEPDDYGIQDGDLEATQLGAVLWHPEEKANLYRRLCRNGRHDLPGLAVLIGSKSVVEVKVYLDNLRDQETDRQRFQAQPKNVSHSEIPAAVEIGADCELALDRAADALLAFQERYDFVTGQQANEQYLIDHAVAEELDLVLDESPRAEDTDEEGTDDELPLSKRAFTLLRLSTFLELSECLFMNGTASNPDSWSTLAETGERPSMTLDSVTALYDLVVNFLRRLLQSCVFLAQSRIRASTSQDYRPSRIVKYEDVAAALDVLGITPNADLFWAGLARRNGLTVLDDAHKRGVDNAAELSYKEVEDALLHPDKMEPVPVATGAATGHSSGFDEASGSSDSTEREYSLDDSSDDDEDRLPADETAPSEGDDDGLAQNTHVEGGPSPEKRPAKIPRFKRLRELEAEQDEYLERLDQKARQQEESRLLSLLCHEEERQIKGEETDDLGVRPRQPRKSVEDCMGWTVNYEAEWESRAKRQKLDEAG